MRASFLRRSPLLLLAAALAALAVFYVGSTPPASAQTTDLASNTGETVAGSDASLTASTSVAQSFRTGSFSRDYVLSSIAVRFQNSVGSAARNSMKAEVWSNHSSGRPGAKLYELTVPGSISAGTATFTAPANTTLARNTSYWFVIWANPITNGLKTTASDDQTGAAGWSIGDAYRDTTDNPPTGSSTWNTPSDSRTLIMTVRGSETPLTAWSATLTVGGYDGLSDGCWAGTDSSDCRSTSVLTDDDFRVKGVNYRIQGLLVIRDGRDRGALVLRLDRAMPADVRAAVTLHVGDRQFPLADAKLTFSDLRVNWYNTGLSWSSGNTVSLSLTVTDSPTTSTAPRPPTFPQLDRLPVDDSVEALPPSRMGEDGTSRNAYCFLGEGNSSSELVRYPDGRIAETASGHSAYIRALYACRD